MRSTVAGDIRHGFVYERVQHVTLKSIANNPDIIEGMSREEIDAAIQRHADFELLYDKPYEDKKKVRVAGPFTVESLSPHRSLAFAGSAVDDGGASQRGHRQRPGARRRGRSSRRSWPTCEAAGIQNGRKNERLELRHRRDVRRHRTSRRSAPARTPTDGTPKRIGITIGPQYGTVGPAFIKDAAREAIKDSELDLLCVLAFAFDPQVLGSRRRVRQRRPRTSPRSRPSAGSGGSRCFWCA